MGSSATLWQLSVEFKKLRAQLAALDGELDDETEQKIDQLQTDLTSKVQRIGMVREAIAEELLIAADWARRTAERKQSLTRELDRLDRYLAHHLGETNLTVELNEPGKPPVTYSARLGRGRTVVPPDAVKKLPPQCLVSQDPKPDLTMVRAMLDGGVPMPAGVRVVKEYKLVVK